MCMNRRTTVAKLMLLCLAAAFVPNPARANPPAETPAQRDKRMAWWREARFGLFVHWGVYSVPAGVYRGKKIAGIGEWIMNRAKIPVGEYEKFAGRFNPTKFDAAAWVGLVKRAGMKYIIITSKHHDGFCIFDSKHTAYDIMDATPFKRDILRELADQCRKQGVRLGFYHSIMDWHHPDAKGKRFAKYRQNYLKPQLKELLTNYGDVAVMWFDGEWIREWTEPQGKDLYRFCRSLRPSVIVNNRVGKGRKGMQGMSKGKTYAGDFGTPEQQIPAKGLPGADWETCMTMNNTWGYKLHDHKWKPAKDLIRKLVDIASKGGNFLLNVGPTAEGLIPAPSVERLEAMGKWLAVNGESIYGTRAGGLDKLPWGRCTRKPGKIYLHVFDWPAGGKLVLPGPAEKVKTAYLLADPKRAPLAVSRQGDKVRIELPAAAPDPIDTVIVLAIEGKPKFVKTPIVPGADAGRR